MSLKINFDHLRKIFGQAGVLLLVATGVRALFAKQFLASDTAVGLIICGVLILFAVTEKR